ncbi:MAG: hypothetical protein ACFB51_15130, partial [Anaerolineae bacterium]
PASAPAIQVDGGKSFGVALLSEGDVWTWGLPTTKRGIEGGDAHIESEPNRINIGGVVEIAASFSHVLALTEGGEVWGWGSNASGALGLPTDQKNVYDPLLILTFSQHERD